MIMKRLRIIIISLLFMKLILKESKSNKKQKPIRRIKVGINHVFKETDGTVDLKRFLPAIYH